MPPSSGMHVTSLRGATPHRSLRTFCGSCKDPPNFFSDSIAISILGFKRRHQAKRASTLRPTKSSEVPTWGCIRCRVQARSSPSQKDIRCNTVHPRWVGHASLTSAHEQPDSVYTAVSLSRRHIVTLPQSHAHPSTRPTYTFIPLPLTMTPRPCQQALPA